MGNRQHHIFDRRVSRRSDALHELFEDIGRDGRQIAVDQYRPLATRLQDNRPYIDFGAD
jgi:hypothetical protein